MENKKKNIWGIIIQTLITILTAIGTSLGNYQLSTMNYQLNTVFRISPVSAYAKCIRKAFKSDMGVWHLPSDSFR